MAIHMSSVLNPPPLPPMAGGVEFYVAECENVDAPSSASVVDPSEPFRASTVLVSFASDDAERAALRPLLQALAFGQTSLAVCDGAEWLQKLSTRLSERPKPTGYGFVTAVIYAGADDDSDAEAVQAAADVLQQCFGTNLVALLVVANTKSHRFDSVQRVSGFVVGASGTNAETARSVSLCLAMFLAPKTLNGLDLFFLKPVFGTATEPTVLADALWLRDGEGRLVFVSAADAQAVHCAVHVVASPLVDGPWTWSEMHRFANAVRNESLDPASMIYFATHEAIAPGLFPSRVSMVPILCAMHQTTL